MAARSSRVQISPLPQMDQIEEVRRKTEIVNLISTYIPLKKAGRNFNALCPFHEEKTPSFMVSAERQIFKCFGCFPAGELVKTPFGSRKIEDVVNDEYVVSGKGEFKKVLRRLERNYHGLLINLGLSQLSESVRLTADHLVYTVGGAKTYHDRYKYLSKRLNGYRKNLSAKREQEKIWKYFPIKKIPANSLKKGMSLLYPINTTITDLTIIDLGGYITKEERTAGTQPRKIPLKLKIDDNLLKLFGYYIAEGSNHRAYIRFSLGGHEQEFAREIVWIISKLFGLRASLYKRLKGKSGLEITVCNSVLANIFENLCGKGANNKHIPFVFQQLTPEKQKILVQAIARGDGYTTKINQRVKTPRGNIITTSRILSEQLTDMLLRMNYYPSRAVIAEHTDKKGLHHGTSFAVSWAINQNVSRFHHKYVDKDGSVYWILPIRKIINQQFSGKVYNLTIDQDHSYVANTFSVANCGEGGDVFKFLMKKETMEFGEALKFLADKAGVELKDFRPSGEQKHKERLLAVNHLTSEFYHYLLTGHSLGKKALDYLLKRGISRTSIETFKLGYSPNNWSQLQQFLVNKKRFPVEELESAGLVIKREGHLPAGRQGWYDRFRGRVIFPLFDLRGRVMGFAGRIMEKEAKEAKYMNSPETLLYHKSNLLYGLETTKEEIKKANRAVVVEGELDLISSYQAGVKNTVAIKGSALTIEQIDLLKRFTQNLSLALDTDAAGDAAARRGIELAENSGLSVRVIQVKFGKDPDECSQKEPKLWRDSVKEAVPIFEFYLNSAVKRFGQDTIEAKKQITREMAAVLSRVTNAVVKAHYVKQTAEILGVNEEAVEEEVEKVGKVAQVVKVVKEEKVRSRQERLEEYLLALVLQSGEWVSEQIEKIKVLDLSETAVKKILVKLQAWLSSGKDWEINRFARSLPEELVGQLDAAYLLDLAGLEQDSLKLENELVRTVKDLNRLKTKSTLSALTEKIKQAETAKDKALVKKLEREFKETASGLV